MHRATKTCFFFEGSLTDICFQDSSIKGLGFSFPSLGLDGLFDFFYVQEMSEVQQQLKAADAHFEKVGPVLTGKTTQKCGFVKESALIFSKIKDDEI